MERNAALRLLRAHPEEFRRFGVRSLSLVGSVARDQARPDSDVDLLVDFERPTGLLGFLRLRNYLEDLVGATVDLMTRRGLDERTLANVSRDAIHVA